MFAALILERDPLQFSKLWAGLEYWIQVAGGFSAAALLIWLFYRLIASFSPEPAKGSNRRMDLAYAAVILAYLAYAGLTSPQWLPAVKATLSGEVPNPSTVSPGMA